MSALAKPLLYTGADAARALDKIRATHANQEQWPYEHVYPPVNSIPVNETGSIVVPAVAAVATILTYKVPSGFKFYLTGLILGLDQSGGLGAYTPVQATWTVTLNTPTGVTNVQASTVQGLTGKTFPLGNALTGNVWPLARAYEFAPLDVLRATGTNLALTAGDPNYFVAAFLGWLVPATAGK